MLNIKENSEIEKYLTEQIITYLGNKRSLLEFIDSIVSIVQEELGKEKLITFDVFSGSGIVARYLKCISTDLYVNDLEGYSNRINHCYLMNKHEYNENVLKEYLDKINTYIEENGLKSGFIAELYSPFDDENIKENERVFFTTRNAKYIDTVRQLIEDIPEPYKTLLISPLLYEASVKNNTSGVFKGFYKNSDTNIGQFGGNGKNALSRILANMEIKLPITIETNCNYTIYQEDSNELVKKLPIVDLAYLDPPYNQHPYSSNYFMLNLINEYKKPENISKVAGIPTNWNKSNYNKKQEALKSLEDLCKNLKAQYILISYNSDGFIKKEEMEEMLSKLGSVRTFAKEYNTFRASRNLHNRDIHINEYLYLLKKGE